MSKDLINRETAFKLREEFGSPLFIYDEESIRLHARRVIEAFQTRVGTKVRFAMKANPIGTFLRFFLEEGIGIDASSGYEATRAIAQGIAPDEILLTSQESPHNLVDLVNSGVRFNATSIHQLITYAELSERPETVSVRFNPGGGSGETRGLTVGGVHSSFGIWHRQIPQVKQILNQHNLKLEHVHTHIGSGADPAAWREISERSIAILKRFPEAKILNLGGGFRASRNKKTDFTDLDESGRHVNAALEALWSETGRDVWLEIEPGAFLMTNSAVLLTTVQDIVQTSPTNRFIKLDAGITEILDPALHGSQFPMWILPANREVRATGNFHVVGHCCESSDTFTPHAIRRGVSLLKSIQEPHIGDILMIGGAGAYCSSSSAANYNSFPRSAEVLRNLDGNFRLIVNRQPLESLWALEV